ncbi:ABC transporter ATP-binding protein [Paraburkholderia ferrariae]|uniref:ABC transporter ATP-binding protein n=1 Tax=Paraburkholderia ferrariae TaxID=386056 RepID=UPI00047FCEF6|nr:ABC transporter ATP-binding protein [Paraburkholderia ferrariae]
MSLLAVEQIGRRFGGVVALDQISFEVEEGEIVGLMGANGAGKTTLFSMIAGNLKPSSGNIRLDGKRISGLTPDQVSSLGVARTFQIVRPFMNMTVLDNVAVGALFGKGRQRTLAGAREQAHALLAEVGLDARAALPAGMLNLAGRKRLEIARALATEPRLLLLDEVLAGLNGSEVTQALELIIEIKQRRALSIVIVEHVMKALMRVSKRIVVLHEGRKLMEGTAEEVTSDPRVIKAYLGDNRYGKAA